MVPTDDVLIDLHGTPLQLRKSTAAKHLRQLLHIGSEMELRGGVIYVS